MKYKIVKNKDGYTEQYEKDVNIEGLKSKLKNLKKRKARAIEQINKIFDSRITEIENKLTK